MEDPRAFWKDEHNHMYYSPYHKRMVEFYRYYADNQGLLELFANEIHQLDLQFWAD